MPSRPDLARGLRARGPSSTLLALLAVLALLAAGAAKQARADVPAPPQPTEAARRVAPQIRTAAAFRHTTSRY